MDLICSAKQTLQGYTWQWSCDVVNFYLKARSGLVDFRSQAYEAVDKYAAVILVARAWVEQPFSLERSAEVKIYGDVIRRHPDEHAIDWLQSADEMVIETGDVELLLHRFLRLEAQPV